MADLPVMHRKQYPLESHVSVLSVSKEILCILLVPYLGAEMDLPHECVRERSWRRDRAW